MIPAPRLAPRQLAIGELYASFVVDIMARMTPKTYTRAYSNGIALSLDAAVNEARLPIWPVTFVSAPFVIPTKCERLGLVYQPPPESPPPPPPKSPPPPPESPPQPPPESPPP